MAANRGDIILNFDNINDLNRLGEHSPELADQLKAEQLQIAFAVESGLYDSPEGKAIRESAVAEADRKAREAAKKEREAFEESRALAASRALAPAEQGISPAILEASREIAAQEASERARREAEAHKKDLELIEAMERGSAVPPAQAGLPAQAGVPAPRAESGSRKEKQEAEFNAQQLAHQLAAIPGGPQLGQGQGTVRRPKRDDENRQLEAAIRAVQLANAGSSASAAQGLPDAAPAPAEAEEDALTIALRSMAAEAAERKAGAESPDEILRNSLAINSAARGNAPGLAFSPAALSLMPVSVAAAPGPAPKEDKASKEAARDAKHEAQLAARRLALQRRVAEAHQLDDAKKRSFVEARKADQLKAAKASQTPVKLPAAPAKRPSGAPGKKAK